MPLPIELHRDQVPWSAEIDAHLQRALRRLRDRLSRFNLSADRLILRFEPREERVWLRLELQIPGDAQTALVEEDHTLLALRTAFRRLFRRFDAYAWSIDHSRWRPLASASGDRQAQLQGYRAELMRYAVPALHRVATHEIERLQDDELLAPDWLDPAEVVDNALVDRIPSLDPSLPLPAATLQLIDAVREELLARVQEIHERQREDLSFEEPMGPSLILTDAEEGELPLEVLELNLADVLGDPEETQPEDLVAERQRRDQLTAALFALPDPRRALFAQVVVDGWPEDMVAAAWQLPIRQVRRAIHEAGELLAKALGDRPVDQVLRLYRTLGTQLSEERLDLEPVGASK